MIDQTEPAEQKKGLSSSGENYSPDSSAPERVKGSPAKRRNKKKRSSAGNDYRAKAHDRRQVHSSDSIKDKTKDSKAGPEETSVENPVPEQTDPETGENDISGRSTEVSRDAADKDRTRSRSNPRRRRRAGKSSKRGAPKNTDGSDKQSVPDAGSAKPGRADRNKPQRTEADRESRPEEKVSPEEAEEADLKDGTSEASPEVNETETGGVSPESGRTESGEKSPESGRTESADVFPDSDDTEDRGPAADICAPDLESSVKERRLPAWQSLRKLFSDISLRCRQFFISFAKKAGYTITAFSVIAVIGVLFCLILFLSLSGKRKSGLPPETAAEEAVSSEGAEASYDGIAPAGESGSGDWSQVIPSGIHDDPEESAIASAFRGLFSRSWEASRALKKQAEDSVRQEYLEILDHGEGDQFTPESGARKNLWDKVRRERRKQLEKEPLLLLVNKWNKLPEDYEVEPVDLPNGQQVGKVCYEPLMEMLRDCEEAGGTPIVCSGFRPHDKQVILFEEQINRWLYAGYSQEEAEALAATAVAIPGSSEHELGLAVDIYSSENMDLDESQVNTLTQQWLMEHCWDYGFILRYPQEKSGITGIIFEPWHYRYVGREYSEIIHETDICLEEFLDRTWHPYSPTDPFNETFSQ